MFDLGMYGQYLASGVPIHLISQDALTPSTLRTLRILWVGPVIDQSRFSNLAVSAAASIWQQGLIEALVAADQGVSIDVLSHLPCQAFPKGALWPNAEETIFPQSVNGFGLRYLNLPKVREWFLQWQYTRRLKQMLERQVNTPYDLIVSYNAEAYVSRPVASVAKDRSLSWIAIIADLPQAQPQAYLIRAKVAQADGRIFLSWNNFITYAKPDQDLFLEGGVHSRTLDDSLNQVSQATLDEQSKIKRVAYFGGITPLGGIDLFLEATRHVLGDQYEFHIIGTGDIARLETFAKRDSRIHYHGPVSQAQLIAIGHTIDVFVDPRPRAFSKNNFPSKILTYLGFAKPIISTLGHGIPPEYQQVLIELKKEDPLVLAQLLEATCAWDQERIAQYQLGIQALVTSSKSWQAQGKRVLSWMRSTIQRQGA